MISLPQPNDLTSLVLRTDFTDDTAWEAVKAALRTSEGEDSATFVSDPKYMGVSLPVWPNWIRVVEVWMQRFPRARLEPSPLTRARRTRPTPLPTYTRRDSRVFPVDASRRWLY